VKTISLKKVSAVAVASLGFGLLSVVPVNAAQAATGFTALNVKAATANTNVTGTSIQVFVGGTLAAPATDWVTTSAATQFYRAAVTTYPTNGFVVPTGEAASPSGLEFLSASSAAVITNTIAGNKITSTKSNAAAFSGAASETVTATGAAGLASYVFTPTVAGSYSITVWNDVSDDGVIDPSEARATTTIVVTAAAGLSTTLSTVRMAGAAQAASLTGNLTDANYTTTANAATRAGYKTSVPEVL